MRYVHLMFNSVFCLPLVNFINEYFGKELHVFFIRDNAGYVCELPETDNVINVNSDIIANSVDFIRTLHNAKKIFLHGMFHNDYISAVLSDESLAKKTTWLVWGGDLTDLDAFGARAELAKKFETIGTSEFDYEIAQSKYGTTGGRKDFLYPSTYDCTRMHKILMNKTRKKEVSILVGNSASAPFDHVKIFNIVKNTFKNDTFTIYTPLSYGEKDYAEYVVKKGKSLFGENYIPLLKFVEPSLYNVFLSKFDVAIFAQIRSQALNTMFALSYFGTKIYCKSKTAHVQQLATLGIALEDVETIAGLSFSEFILNKSCLMNHYCGKALIDNSCQKEIWKKLIFC